MHPAPFKNIDSYPSKFPGDVDTAGSWSIPFKTEDPLILLNMAELNVHKGKTGSLGVWHFLCN